MKKYFLTLNSRPFYNILNRKKKWEGRLYRGSYKRIKPDDIIYFTNDENEMEKRTLAVKITSIHIFSTFEDAFMSIKNTLAVPNHSLNETLKIYHSFYPKKMVKKYGVVFYGIKLMKIYQRKILIKKV